MRQPSVQPLQKWTWQKAGRCSLVPPSTAGQRHHPALMQASPWTGRPGSEWSQICHTYTGNASKPGSRETGV